jgi:hypothetical protein
MKTCFCTDCGSLDINIERVFSQLTRYRYQESDKGQGLTIEDPSPASRVLAWWCEECCGAGNGPPASFLPAQPPPQVLAWLKRSRFTLAKPKARAA